MDSKKYQKFEVSKELNAQVVSEIKRVQTISKTKDYEIAERLGKSKQGYSYIVNNLSNLGNIEAIANALGCTVRVYFVHKEGV